MRRHCNLWNRAWSPALQVFAAFLQNGIGGSGDQMGIGVRTRLVRNRTLAEFVHLFRSLLPMLNKKF